MLSRRDVIAWFVAFVIVSGLIVITGFASEDPDSALYAALSARLAEGPASHWIAPEWWGNWNSEGWFHENPAGVFFLPILMSKIGIPAVQAAYVVGIAAGLACLLLFGRLITQVAGKENGRATLVLLQLMPVAFVFRIRANHEYPMLLCLLMVLVGLDGARRSWWWTILVACGLACALLIKGVFVVLILLAAALWILLNPAGTPGSMARPIGACLIGLLAMVGAALLYDVAYARATGDGFWLAYWRRQLGPLTLSTPFSGAKTLAYHSVYYASRLLWHPAPWSLAIVAAAWVGRGRLQSQWAELPDNLKRGGAFALLFVVMTVGLLSPSSRFAERYIFAPVYVFAATGVVVALRTWPLVSRALNVSERAIPSLPAALWFLLMVSRLAFGPFLPRIT